MKKSIQKQQTLSGYELERLARIRENEALLASLNISADIEGVKKKKAPRSEPKPKPKPKPRQRTSQRNKVLPVRAVVREGRKATVEKEEEQIARKELTNQIERKRVQKAWVEKMKEEAKQRTERGPAE